MLNLKRAVGFSIFLWVIIFVVYSVLMFLPWVKESESRISIIWYILEIPIVLLWAKMYFKGDSPTSKKGLLLGLVALLVGTILDIAITVPVFIKDYATYYGDWTLYVGFVEMIILTTFAGGEFDGTFSKPQK